MPPRTKRTRGRGRHSAAGSSEHHLWKALIQKCTNPSHRDYRTPRLYFSRWREQERARMMEMLAEEEVACHREGRTA